MILTLDFETRSPVDLSTRGAWVYARHPGAKVLFTGVAVDDAPAITIPARELRPLIKKADIVVAHNAVFEWLIARYVLKIDIPVEKLHCTMAMAGAMGLPLNLDTLAEALGLPGKDKEGYAAMLKECKPRRPRKGEDPNGTYYYDNPLNFERMERYCRGDVDIERRVFHKLKRLSDTERKVWLMDFAINRRGIPLDCYSINLLRTEVERRRESQLIRFKDITGDTIESPQSYVELAKWVSRELGRPVPSVAKAAVTELLEGDLPAHVREVLEIKAELSKSSVAKFDAMLNRQVNGRLQGAHQYYGAATGRWAGRGFQPQNLQKDSYGEEDYERILAYLDQEDLRFFYGDPFYFASKCIRGSIATVGNPESLFFCADFGSIESRGLAYLAGETWVLDAYRAGMDLYKLFAAQALGKRYEEITSKERQVPGKGGVLACGFGGGPGICRRFGIDGVDEFLYETIVNPWREANPKAVQFWYEMESAVVQAIRWPGKIFTVGFIKVVVQKGFLLIRLPSGRCIHYYQPSLVESDKFSGKMEIRYWANKVVDGKTTAQWARVGTYGGKIVENVVQGFCRDLLASAMLRLEAAGFPIVMHVHDEVICEVNRNADFDKFLAIMKEVPAWAPGLPIDATGWKGRRYRKD